MNALSSQQQGVGEDTLSFAGEMNTASRSTRGQNCAVDTDHDKGHQVASIDDEMELCDRMLKSAAELGRTVFGYPRNPSLLITSPPCKTHYLDCPADLFDE